MAHPCRRILIVEDEPAYGEALERLLTLDGHAVARVPDGAMALDRIAADGLSLDLVLTDLLLPRKSGFEVVRGMRELGIAVPVLVMTGVYAQAREIAALRGLGVAGYVHKSAPMDHILFRVNSVLFPTELSIRQSVRVAVSIPVEYPTEEGRRWAVTYNLSCGGVYVRTPDPPPAGEVVRLVLVLPTAREPLAVDAEVVHAAAASAVEGTAYPAGFGARFLEPTPLVAAALRHFVDGMLEAERNGDFVVVDGDAAEFDAELVPAQTCS